MTFSVREKNRVLSIRFWLFLILYFFLF